MKLKYTQIIRLYTNLNIKKNKKFKCTLFRSRFIFNIGFLLFYILYNMSKQIKDLLLLIIIYIIHIESIFFLTLLLSWYNICKKCIKFTVNFK